MTGRPVLTDAPPPPEERPDAETPAAATLDDALRVTLGRLSLANPILLASGTAGYLREMQPFCDLARLGGVIPKTVTRQMRPGNRPPRTVETSAGMLNSIGLDNDGIDHFIAVHLPFLRTLGTAVVANIAGRTVEDFAEMAGKLAAASEQADAVELNVSCPNVSGGVDFGTNPDSTAAVVKAVRENCDLPIVAKLTPNVVSCVPMAQAAYEAGADAVSLVNTFQGMAIDWRRARPILGNNLGGLSGPAIKPLALRVVHQVASVCDVPIIGIGGIQCLDDVMEFLVAGATAVQIGTANFYNPSLSAELVDGLSGVVAASEHSSVAGFVRTLTLNRTA